MLSARPLKSRRAQRNSDHSTTVMGVTIEKGAREIPTRGGQQLGTGRDLKTQLAEYVDTEFQKLTAQDNRFKSFPPKLEEVFNLDDPGDKAEYDVYNALRRVRIPGLEMTVFNGRCCAGRKDTEKESKNENKDEKEMKKEKKTEKMKERARENKNKKENEKEKEKEKKNEKENKNEKEKENKDKKEKEEKNDKKKEKMKEKEKERENENENTNQKKEETENQKENDNKNEKEKENKKKKEKKEEPMVPREIDFAIFLCYQGRFKVKLIEVKGSTPDNTKSSLSNTRRHALAQLRNHKEILRNNHKKVLGYEHNVAAEIFERLHYSIVWPNLERNYYCEACGTSDGHERFKLPPRTCKMKGNNNPATAGNDVFAEDLIPDRFERDLHEFIDDENFSIKEEEWIDL